MWLKSAKNDILNLKEQPMNELTQINDVLTHLKEKGSITSAYANDTFGASRLSSIIYILRGIGYIIDTIMQKGKTRYKRPCRYALYVLRGETKQ